MTIHTPNPLEAAVARDLEKEFRADPIARLEKFDTEMRRIKSDHENRIAKRKKTSRETIASFQAEKKAAKARYEAEMLRLDTLISEEREASQAEVEANSRIVEKARAALAVQAAE